MALTDELTGGDGSGVVPGLEPQYRLPEITL